VDTVLGSAGLRELPLAGLAATEAGELAQVLADVPLSATVRERIAEISAGNPLAVRELARDPHSLTRLPPGSTVPLPARLSDLFERRAGTLGPQTRALLALTAVAGGDLPVMARACDALGLDLGGLVEAEQHGLVAVSVDKVDFTHPLARLAPVLSRARARRVGGDGHRGGRSTLGSAGRLLCGRHCVRAGRPSVRCRRRPSAALPGGG
jgi:hypothetical protein